MNEYSEQKDDCLTLDQIAIIENKCLEEEEEIYWDNVRAQET